MKTSQRGIDLIKEFEGCKLEAYKDSVGIPTIGVGHTKNVCMEHTITMEQADALLRADLADAEKAVNQYVGVPLTQNQFDALVSFTFNLGAGALLGSTLLSLLGKGNYLGAAEQFGRWNRAGGKVLLGLARRRAAERELFLEGSP